MFFNRTAEMSTSPHMQHLYWLSVSVAVFVIDQISKFIATTKLFLLSRDVITPFFNLCLSFNRGAAFGFLHHAGGWQRWFFVAMGLFVCASIVVWLYRLPKQEKLLPLALALILGGALANLWDRLVLGYVVDFIQLHVDIWYFPTFNVADAAISLGAALVFIAFLRKKSYSTT